MKDYKIIGFLFIVLMVLSIFYTFWNKEEIQGINEPDNIVNEENNGNHTVNNEREDDTNSLAEDLSLDEKIGQLIITNVTGTHLTTEMQTLFDTYKIGGFIFFSHNFETDKQALSLINDLKSANEHNRIPLFLTVDQEGGRVTRLPGLLNLPANSQLANLDEEIAFEYGQILGEQLLSFGLNVNYAPVLDVLLNDKNEAIGDRAFSSDVDKVALLGSQLMKGLQKESIIPAIKHFPGHGNVKEDSHETLPINNDDYETLLTKDLFPLKNAIDEGADLVMVGHLLYTELDDEYPSSLSKTIISEILRGKLEFNGVVIIDDLTMDAIRNDYSLEEAVLLYLEAGGDLILTTEGVDAVSKIVQTIKKAIEEGQITEERIDESVERILALKEKYELEDTMVEQLDIEDLNQTIKAFNKKIKTSE